MTGRPGGSAMINSLQVLRFAAAFMVVYIHAAQVAVKAAGSTGLLPAQFAIVGQAGVDIFFVISGVLITRTAAGLTWQEFAGKRLRRIAPLYYIVLIPVLLIVLRNGAGLSWREFVATFLLWPATDVMTVPILPVAWTLCFEALFYVAATFTVADRRWLIPILALFAASLVLRSQGAIFQFLGNPLIFEFLFGVGLAVMPPLRRAAWLIPLGAAALMAAGFLGLAPTGRTLDFLLGAEGYQRVLVFGLPAALIVYGTMQVSVRESFWTRQGDASYALYLTHPMLLSTSLVFWKFVALPPDLIILTAAVVSVLFGWRVHVLVEKPVIALINRRRWSIAERPAV
jgi:exopolysaccharide production protein ExoZ